MIALILISSYLSIFILFFSHTLSVIKTKYEFMKKDDLGLQGIFGNV